MRPSCLVGGACLILMLLGPVHPLVAQSGGSCEAPEFHQLDFWIGEWVVHSGTEKTADVVIEPVVFGCALREQWTSAGWSSPDIEAVAAFESRTGEWQYYWVSASGSGSVTIWTGQMLGEDSIRFVYERTTEDGGTRLHRWDLSQLPDGRLRELQVGSTDGGRTWETDYDLHWTRVGRQ